MEVRLLTEGDRATRGRMRTVVFIGGDSTDVKGVVPGAVRKDRPRPASRVTEGCEARGDRRHHAPPLAGAPTRGKAPPHVDQVPAGLRAS